VASTNRADGRIKVERENIHTSYSNEMLPTDCPQRGESMGWTGGAQVFSGTSCFSCMGMMDYSSIAETRSTLTLATNPAILKI
jgi:hypothetical protein